MREPTHPSLFLNFLSFLFPTLRGHGVSPGYPRAIRVALLVLFVALLIGCESRPAFMVPDGESTEVALDARFPVWTEGRWALDEFEGELAIQLEKYRVHVVGRTTRPSVVVEIDLGLLGYGHAVDVYVREGGSRTYAGRVRVPDRTFTTLDAAAPLVAALVARAVYHLDPPPAEQR
ncbi:MAG TPA: hypothetical protein VIF09_21420 [Polyangiaceae bacterium]